MQAELLNVLTVAGIAPKKAQFNQLALAIKAIVNKDALLKTNLLSEIKEAGAAAQKTARDNIGLKGGATADLTTSDHDITAGRLLKVGDYGLGVSNGSVKSLASIYDITCSGEYNAMGSGTASPTVGIPADSGNTRFTVYAGNIYSNQYQVILTSNAHFYVGLVNTASKTATWTRFYNTLNKPNANDVSAIPVDIVGVINDNKTIASANKTGWWRVAVSNTATISDFPTFPGGVKLYGYGYLFVDLSSGSWLQHYYSHRGQNAKRQGWDGPLPTPDTSWVIEYNTANKPTPEDIGALPISGGQLTGGLGLHRGILFFPESAYKNKAEGLTGTYATDALDYRWELYARSKANSSIRSNIFTVDIIDISKGSTASGGGSNNTTTITFHGRIVTPFAIQPGDWSNFDARYQAKGNYTPAGEAYTKAASDARYVQNIRVSATQVRSFSDGGGYSSNDAAFATAIAMVGGSSNNGSLLVRYVQKLVNGTWVNITT